MPEESKKAFVRDLRLEAARANLRLSMTFVTKELPPTGEIPATLPQTIMVEKRLPITPELTEYTFIDATDDLSIGQVFLTDTIAQLMRRYKGEK